MATEAANQTGTAAVNQTATQIANETAIASTATAACANFSYHSLIINEVGWMGTSSSTTSDEWVELYNPTSCTIDLSGGNGWHLVGSNSVYSSGRFTIALTGIIAPGGYFLLMAKGGTFQNPPAPTQVSSSLSLPDSYQSLRLTSPASSQIDTANYSGGYSWPAGKSYPNYQSMERRGLADDSPTAWVTFAGPRANIYLDRNGRQVFGTPGGPNWSSTVTVTPSPRPTATKKVTRTPTRSPTPFPHVVINEFLPRAGFDWNNDGEVNVYDEFIEIENLGPINVTLSGWKLDDDANVGASPFALPSKTLKPGERAIYYGSQTHIPLYDSGGQVRLINSRGVVVDARGYTVVKYPDQSVCRIPDGIGYWTYTCFPTPGNENSLTGSLP
ncbi:MAG TPA: lamin tail domain-containing protein, partial [Anaerolineales bacterium]|nr:lamin tail domain-containing protein [Anaerolineales bacterium]